MAVCVMLRLFTRSRREPRVLPGRRVRLSLEALEARDCPTNFAIMNFTATVLAGHMVQLNGLVTDDDPASVQLTFSGAASGTTTPAANGNFSFGTPNATLGTVNVNGVNKYNLQANASATISKPSPVVTLNITYGSKTLVTLSGSVNDLDKAG